jgi:hypothetical protein
VTGKMKRKIKTPCGAITIVSFKDEAERDALLKKLTADHAEPDGPGCIACKTEKWTVQRTEPPSDGTSLLDHAR